MRTTTGRWLAIVAGLFLAATLSACSSGSSSSNATGPSSTSLPDAACAAKLTPGPQRVTYTIDGRRRIVRIYVPQGYAGASLIPLVVNLHGSGSTAAAQERITAMDATADQQQFFVAYPQGLIADGSGFDWNVPGVPLTRGRAVPAGSPSDLSFVTQLVKQLSGRLCVDANRVYATGFSGGARLASQLGCDAANTFAAIAPVAGLRFPPSCHPSRPVPVIAFHGTADPVDPYNGNGDKYWTYGVPDAARRWAASNSCATKPARSNPAPTVTLDTYSGCRGNADVELYTVEGMGHEWPGGPTLPPAVTSELGPQSSAISANELMWPFFTKHFRS